MSGDLIPLGIGLLVAVAAVVVIALFAGRITRPRRRRPVAKLPQGAEAALWSIIEPLPDPRNHLALTRDLSGEVRITDSDRVAVAALFEPDTPVPERWAPEFSAPEQSAPELASLPEPLRPPSSVAPELLPEGSGWSPIPPTPPASNPDHNDENYVIVLAEGVSDRTTAPRLGTLERDRAEPDRTDHGRELQPAHTSAGSEPERQWKRLFDRTG
jgi:hypothetical protein